MGLWLERLPWIPLSASRRRPLTAPAKALCRTSRKAFFPHMLHIQAWSYAKTNTVEGAYEISHYFHKAPEKTLKTKKNALQFFPPKCIEMLFLDSGKKRFLALLERCLFNQNSTNCVFFLLRFFDLLFYFGPHAKSN